MGKIILNGPGFYIPMLIQQMLHQTPQSICGSRGTSKQTRLITKNRNWLNENEEILEQSV